MLLAEQSPSGLVFSCCVAQHPAHLAGAGGRAVVLQAGPRVGVAAGWRDKRAVGRSDPIPHSSSTAGL